MAEDHIYAKPEPHLVDFAFDERVAAVFPDMIRRSVPGYDAIISLLGVFAREYVQPNSRIYDLGCSLGAASLALRRQIVANGCTLIAVDNAPAMVSCCRENLAADQSITAAEVRSEDVIDTEISNASLVTMNFTLQFVDPKQRLPLLKKIYQGLNAGGALLVSEKIHAADSTAEALQTNWHHGFKRANGYSDLEISQKRQAIENVLRTDSLATHQQRLRQAGFAEVLCWFQAFNFISLVALKE